MPVWKLQPQTTYTELVDARLDLSCAGYSLTDLRLELTASVPRDKYDFVARLGALAMDTLDAPFTLTTAGWYAVDYCTLVLRFSDGEITKDIQTSMQITDGVTTKDVSLILRAGPCFMRGSSKSYHRLSSVCKEA